MFKITENFELELKEAFEEEQEAGVPSMMERLKTSLAYRASHRGNQHNYYCGECHQVCGKSELDLLSHILGNHITYNVSQKKGIPSLLDHLRAGGKDA